MSKSVINATSILNFIKYDLLLGRQLDAPLTEDTDLIKSSIIDSLSLIQLVTNLEREFGISIDDQDINPDNFQDVRSLVVFIQGKVPEIA